MFVRARGIRRAGSAALDLALVAAGVYDGFFELQLAPWDVAAGAILIEEAGGAVTDFDGGDRFWDRGNILAGPAGNEADAAREAWREALTILTQLNHPDAEQLRAKLKS